ncbi:hypothetical protein DJ82_03145 [Halorubrum sp. Ib24]|uniref:hypothetical protein n=1 Tax=unclassified Halorubrum TaxID=2642239 RepID=UPI000B989A23|nr:MULTISPECIES: hypothetical protein [unclassified Halorubrum]OYR42215.1 hypothetical protein DJ82_03145 [Halorubrum sp. Ib24]OYR43991.1 hypothetical protein DJ75_09865 [Halorubrum sp. Eb13]OYR45960.1 hypothetical protein DJ81_03930 [Halorubrum sp. Hd13]OYR49102.1 hypothetical protein DJ74_09325 [Halorubrum sp. Ea8]
MGQRTLGGDDLTRLRETYLQRVTGALPKQAAEAGDWPIHRDHCFARVVLDGLFEGVWYDHVDGTPAYEQLSADELRAAIAIADRMLEEGKPAVEALNRQSLRWRDH